MGIDLRLGDCLEVMRDIPSGSVDAVVTDPPYCSGARMTTQMYGRGGMSRGERWNDKPLDNDQMTSVGFVWLMRQVALEAERILTDGGSLLSFIDWRQYPNLYGAIETANLRVQMMVVWDKSIMGLGNGFRNQHELVIHAAKGVPRVYDRATPNVLRTKRISSSDIHPTEKPVPIMERLLAVVADEHCTVLDPFMGSGTTGIACVFMGCNFIGIERDPEYFQIAQRRIQQAQDAGKQLELAV